MSDAVTHQAGQAIRASDGERDQVVAQLQRHFADGRLTQAELEERVGAALAARTRDQLHPLTADLPGAGGQRRRSRHSSHGSSTVAGRPRRTPAPGRSAVRGCS